MSQPKPVRLQVVTANIGRGVPTAVARRNIALVLRRWPSASIGWQEIDEADGPDEHQLLHEYLKKVARPHVDELGLRVPSRVDSLRAVGWMTAVPVFVPPGWRILERYIDKTCDGRTGVTPTRVCVQVLLEHVATRRRLVRLNGHYPHGAPDLWEQCDAAWQLIAAAWRSTGYASIATRDVNQARRVPLHKTERLLLGAGLDKITFVPGSNDLGVRVQQAAPGRRVPLSIDGHDALGMTLIVKPPRGATARL